VWRARNTAGRLKASLSYANVMATLAVFLGLGGTTYALTLPRNSVDSKQLRRGSVGTSELRRGAVRSRDIRDATIRLEDVSDDAAATLRGQTGPPGPPGPTYFAAVNSGGGVVRGNGRTGSDEAGVREVGFDRSVEACVATATLANVTGAPEDAPPSSGRIAIGAPGPRVEVRTWLPNGTPAYLPFNVVVAC
jgi:hypothetical protein